MVALQRRRLRLGGVRSSTEARAVKCVICRNGETRPGKATVTLEREGMILVVKGVPARVCENRGEEYVEEAEATRLLTSADEAARAGVKVDVRDYVAA